MYLCVEFLLEEVSLFFLLLLLSSPHFNTSLRTFQVQMKQRCSVETLVWRSLGAC